MQINKMKNIVVLKGMDSNVVEEAIVVLKPNIKLKQTQHINKNNYTLHEKNKRKTILMEAEHVINSYVKKIQMDNLLNQNIKMKKKYKEIKIINIFLIIVLFICIIKII